MPFRQLPTWQESSRALQSALVEQLPGVPVLLELMAELAWASPAPEPPAPEPPPPAEELDSSTVFCDDVAHPANAIPTRTRAQP